MLGQIPNEEEINKYFISQESPECNEGGRLEIIILDENSHLKIPPSWHSHMVHDLANLFTNNFYLIPSNFKQEKQLHDETKNMIHEMFEVGEKSQVYLEAYEGEPFIITKSDITKFKD
jgi:NADH:ubiquinone oxidoreductase subunit